MTCTATDAAGNTGDGPFAVTVVDTTGPAITVPADSTVEATGPAGARPAFNATATDLVDGDTAGHLQPPGGSTFALGVDDGRPAPPPTPRQHQHRDLHGRCRRHHRTGPHRPGDLTVEATGPDGQGRLRPPPPTPSSTDVGRLLRAPGRQPFALGDHTVDCSATDVHSNTASDSFTVTVTDTTAPALTVPDDIIAEATGPDGAVTGRPRPPTS